jgi:hypothetical protein
MIDYIKFWLAKELAQLGLAVAILAAIFLAVAAFAVLAKIEYWIRRRRLRRHNQRKGT